MSREPYTWEAIQGDDEDRIFTIQDGDGVAIDLTGMTALVEFDINGYVRSSLDVDPEVHVQITNPTGGEITVSADNSFTALWRRGVEGRFYLTVVALTKVHTKAWGSVRVIA